MEAPTAAAADEAELQFDPEAEYQKFDRLVNDSLGNQPKQGQRLIGTVVEVDQKGAQIDFNGKAPAQIDKEELSMYKVDRVTDVLCPDMTREFVVLRDDHKNNRSGIVYLSLKRIEQEVAWKRVKQLAEEDVQVTVLVQSLNKGGLMVALHGLQGFVPISHLPAGAAQNLQSYIGQELAVKFLDVDPEQNRMVFSSRRATSDNRMQSMKIGDVVLGTVQSVKPYGAFVDLGNGTSGLLHISQISHDRITNVGSVLSEGDQLKVMILTQDKERGRMALSTKKLEPSPGDMLKDPKLVFDRADEMAEIFRQRLAQAEAAARAQDGELVPAANA
jgi:small subunit ribosomal protein S1